MKKLLLISLLLAVFYSTIGFYILFKVEEYNIRQEIKHCLISNLSGEELELLIIFHADEGKIHWVEEGKEFRYDGNMYDVVKTREFEHATYYYCYNDRKETKLMACLDKLIREQANHSKSRVKVKKIPINYFLQRQVFRILPREQDVQYFGVSTEKYAIFQDVISPPPRVG
ncbi:MAG: hypothetical protein KKA07_02380 [Bacteroidetes bacterium]|nr:hypothetical protein [Bacteroidota bacterium]MBU1717896.1 hypothetical protein [Bacteroidota bacterium]